MRLTVRFFGDLTKYLPKGQKLLQLELPEGATPTDMLKEIGIHPGEVWIVRANQQVIQQDQPFKDGDFVEIFDPVGGG